MEDARAILHSGGVSASITPARHTRESGCLNQVLLMEDARLHGHDGRKEILAFASMTAKLIILGLCNSPWILVLVSLLSHPRKRVSQSSTPDGRCPSTRA